MIKEYESIEKCFSNFGFVNKVLEEVIVGVKEFFNVVVV